MIFPMSENAEIENKRKRLIYRAWHRGMREMDMLIGNFARNHVPDFNEQELQEFEEMLSYNDQDLYDWYSKRRSLPAEKESDVMMMFLNHGFSA